MTIRYGILGPGIIAQRFAKVLAQAEGVSLQAVASRDPAKARAFAAEFGAAQAYATHEELLADPKVDIVYIASTHNYHFASVKACLEAGKAVLCEKPLVLTAREAEELISLSRKKNVLLMEAMWTRCLPAYQKALEWVKAGHVGKVSVVDAAFSFSFPYQADHRLYDPKLAGGSLFDAGVYPIEFALGMVGEAPSSVKAEVSLAPSGVDDQVALALKFPGGAVASLTCGFKAQMSTDAVVYGPQGKVVVYNFLGTQKCERFDNHGKSLEVFEKPHADGFVYEILHAAQLVRDHRIESPLIPHADTLACARIFDAVVAQFPARG